MQTDTCEAFLVLATLLGQLDHGQLPAAFQYRVDHAVGLGLLAAHEVVAIRVHLDLLDRLAGVLGEDLVEPVAGVEDLPRVDLDVGGLALERRPAAGGS